MDSTSRLRLLQLGGAWGAPSVDVQCTKAQAWLRVAGCRYEVEDASRAAQPTWSAGTLPVLRDGAFAVEAAAVYAHLRETRGIDADAALSSAERAEVAAFEAAWNSDAIPVLNVECESRSGGAGRWRVTAANELRTPHPTRAQVPTFKRFQPAQVGGADRGASRRRDALRFLGRGRQLQRRTAPRVRRPASGAPVLLRAVDDAQARALSARQARRAA
jgi:hypothetical protein